MPAWNGTVAICPGEGCQSEMSWFKHRNAACAPGWGSFVWGVVHATTGNMLLFSSWRLKQPLLFAEVNFTTVMDGDWTGLFVILLENFPFYVLIFQRSLWKQQETFCIYAQTFTLPIGFSESFMFCSVSKRLLPLKLYFIMLLREMAVLFLLVGLVSHILSRLYVSFFIFF